MDKKNKNANDDLIGFKEFIEYEEKKKPSRGKVSGGNFDLLSFLENESKRLSKTIDLCEEKIYTLNKYPQAGHIENKQDSLINKNKSVLGELLIRKDSPLTKNLEEILRQHFSK